MDDRTLSLIILIFAAAFILGTWLSPRPAYLEYTGSGVQPVVQPPLSGDTTLAVISVPAIGADGEGVITDIAVQAMPGTGRTLTNIDRIFFWVDTQHSIRLARSVAENVTGLDIRAFDLIYTITADASVIEGPSAGAALTVATIAALENRSIRDDTMITGSIKADGSIGPAGGIREKAIAARGHNASSLLVPPGASGRSGTERDTSCDTMNSIEYCEVNYITTDISLGEEVGMDIIEVEDIGDVMEMILS